MPGMDFNAVIQNMLNGVDVLLVDPQIYPHLISPLYVFRDVFTSQNQRDMVKKCNFLIEYIEDYPHRLEIKAALANKFPEPEPKPPALEPDVVNSIVDNILQTGTIKFFPREELELVLAELRKRKQEMISSGDYVGAQKADHYTKAVMNYGQLGEVEQMQESKTEEIRNKLADAKAQLASDKQRWEQFHQNLMKEAKTDLTNIYNQYESEIDELDAQHEIEKLPPKFTKASKALLQLRRRQEAMIASKHYEAAADVKDIADKMEAEEAIVHRARWNAYLEDCIYKKRQEQKKQIEGRKNYWKKEEASLIAQANKEVEKAEKSIEHLEKSLEQASNAHALAASLKEETKVIPKGLPPLTRSPTRSDAAAYRQRAILNQQIYTRPVAKK